MSLSCSREECINFVVDFLQISFHQVLWSRKLYPREIFAETQKFNALVYKSRHPEVNKYLDSILATIRSLLNQNFIEKAVMLIKEDKTSKPVERFVFELNSFFKTTQSNGKVSFNLAELQEQARAIWLTIGYRFSADFDEEKYINCTYTFELHTKRGAYEDILEHQTTEDFLWIEADKVTNPSGVVPVKKLNCQPFSIELYVEDYRDDVQ